MSTDWNNFTAAENLQGISDTSDGDKYFSDSDESQRSPTPEEIRRMTERMEQNRQCTDAFFEGYYSSFEDALVRSGQADKNTEWVNEKAHDYVSVEKEELSRTDWVGIYSDRFTKDDGEASLEKIRDAVFSAGSHEGYMRAMLFTLRSWEPPEYAYEIDPALKDEELSELFIFKEWVHMQDMASREKVKKADFDRGRLDGNAQAAVYAALEIAGMVKEKFGTSPGAEAPVSLTVRWVELLDDISGMYRENSDYFGNEEFLLEYSKEKNEEYIKGCMQGCAESLISLDMSDEKTAQIIMDRFGIPSMEEAAQIVRAAREPEQQA